MYISETEMEMEMAYMEQKDTSINEKPIIYT